MLEEGAMRYTTLLATAALALALPFILAHCASVPGRLTCDANSVGKPNSGAPMELWLPPPLWNGKIREKRNRRTEP